MDGLKKKKDELEIKAGRIIGQNKRNMKAKAKHIEMLMKVQCNTRWSDKDNEVFIVPSKWLNYWKDSINSGNSKCDSEGKMNPGIITYNEIMVSKNDYYHSLEKESQFDWVLRETVEEEKDYYVASKELWEFLHELYGGPEAIRYRTDSYASHRKLDIKFSKVYFYNENRQR